MKHSITNIFVNTSTRTLLYRGPKETKFVSLLWLGFVQNAPKYTQII